jgi:hypothetical protein
MTSSPEPAKTRSLPAPQLMTSSPARPEDVVAGGAVNGSPAARVADQQLDVPVLAPALGAVGALLGVVVCEGPPYRRELAGVEGARVASPRRGTNTSVEVEQGPEQGQGPVAVVHQLEQAVMGAPVGNRRAPDLPEAAARAVSDRRDAVVV